MKLVSEVTKSATSKMMRFSHKRAHQVICQCIDHTSLSPVDTPNSTREFIGKMKNLDIQPATVCIYPSLIETAALTLGESAVGISAVCGAFPSGQTYLEIKLHEIAMAIENGADEIDLVINIGAILDEEYDIAQSEIEAIVTEIDGDATLKVILETGLIQDPKLIYNASLAAMRAGADFIKTSTGRFHIGASHEAVSAICLAIADYYKESERKVGVKIAGGVKDFDDALPYYAIVLYVLGEEWLCPSLLRFGSSSLAHAIDGLEPTAIPELDTYTVQ